MNERKSKLWLGDRKLVLASASAVRRQMLQAADVPIEVDPARVDERELETTRGVGLDPAGVAVMLAEAKAVSVSQRLPGRLVLGSDQTLEFEGATYAKAESLAEAESRLNLLSGKTHTLHAAFCFARNGEAVKRGVRAANLTMRPLSAAFIETYLETCGETVLGSVGVYQVEGPGIHLFEQIDGDWFTILGLPLGDVLSFLREDGALLA